MASDTPSTPIEAPQPEDAGEASRAARAKAEAAKAGTITDLMPHIGQPGIASLIRALRKIDPTGPMPPKLQAKFAKKAKIACPPRRGQCTHMNVVRVFNQFCQTCWMMPLFVYQCVQDSELEEKKKTQQEFDLNKQIGPETAFNEIVARYAESLHMNKDTISGIRNGIYNDQQIEKLIRQKEHVNDVINGTSPITPPTIAKNSPASCQGSESVIASVGTPASSETTVKTAVTATPSAVPQTAPTQNSSKFSTQPGEGCHFSVCHRCRPYMQDRVYMNLEAVLNNEVKALTKTNMTELRVLDAKVLRTIGLRENPNPVLPRAGSDESIDISMQPMESFHDSHEWTPTSTAFTESDTDADAYPCPGIKACPVFDPNSGCAYDNGFDDGLRALNHGFGPDPDLSRITPENSMSRLRHMPPSIIDTPGRSSSTASSMSLPTPANTAFASLVNLDAFAEEDMTETPTKGKMKQTIDDYSPGPRPLTFTNRHPRRIQQYELPIRTAHDTFRIMHKPSSNSIGSEVEVEGGVALTEEALQTGTPDIATKPL